MLNISFFITTFSSILWIIYSWKYIHLQTISSITELQAIVMVLLLPIAVLWIVFALIKSHFEAKINTLHIYKMLDQINAGLNTMSNLEKNLITAETEIKNSFVVQEFNLLISDINEILSDIMKRSNSISSAQLEHLWTQTSGGERWIIAKTFIEITNFQTDFSEHLKEKALRDKLLRGSILEFVSRYNSILSLMKSYDSHQIFYNMIEYGALGKVFDILSPISTSITDTSKKRAVTPKPIPFEEKSPFSLTQEPIAFPSFLSEDEPKVERENKEVPVIAKKEPTIIEEGLRAIREEILPPQESISKEERDIPIISSFTQTQMAIRSVKNAEPIKSPTKEYRKTPVISLDEIEKEINASPDNNYDELAYPFGAWLDEKKNQ